KTNSVTGYSLVELAVTLAFSAVLMTIAIPAYQSTWIQKYRLHITTNKLAASAHTARIRAAATNRPCVIAFDSQGWDVFIDLPPYDNVFDLNGIDNTVGTADDEIFIHHVDFPKGVSYYTAMGGGDGITFDTPENPSITFNPRGLSIDNSGIINDGTVFLQNKSGVVEYVNVTGIGNITSAQI
ncbi:GspH/FimT family pseudopilin, partial [Thermodesulfobacteriota bacterium]